MNITLPKLFTPREYQKEVMKQFFIEKKKRILCVWHRRAGKDRVWLNILIAAAMQRKGLYYYTFPTLTLARKAIWEGIGKDGTKFLDQIPKEIIKGKPNNSEMKIEFVNGSIMRMAGTDQYDKLRGTNPLGVIFSEYAEQNPMAWNSVIRPILSENGGWASFIYTPRGHNHGYDLYHKNASNDNWYTTLLTVDDTFDIDGNPVITKEAIEEERRAGMSDDLINQEYYCSFEASNAGAIFARQFDRAYNEKRIKDFPIDNSIPVYTFWDLGRDGTSIWLIQRDGEYWKAIYYYENVGQHINHYFEALEAIRKKYNLFYAKHILPHDAINKPIMAESNVAGYFSKMMLPYAIVRRIDHKEQAIEAGRVAFDRTIFHSVNCEQGLNSLRSYHRAFNEKLKIFSEDPVHDWASHGSDAFMQFGQALKDGLLNNEQMSGILYNRVNTGI